jgi:hypothetical protein
MSAGMTVDVTVDETVVEDGGPLTASRRIGGSHRENIMGTSAAVESVT